MNLENSTAPATGSGQGQAAPASSSATTGGQGFATPNQGNGQGTQQQTSSSNQSGVDTNGLPQAAMAELDKRTGHFNQKITELANQRATLERRLQDFESQNQQRNQALAQALGFAQQQTQPVDIVSELIDNPGRLNELIQQEAKKLVEPINQRLAQRDTAEFLYSQKSERAEIENSLRQSGSFTDDFIKEAMNVTSLVPATIFKDAGRLDDPMVSQAEKVQINAQIENDIAKFIQQAGGIRRLIHSKVGEQFTSNLGSIAKQLVQSERQRQYAFGRGNTASNMMGSAGTKQAPRGAVNYRTEYIAG